MITLPNFLIIGAGKSGTTSLDYYLKQHPQVYLPEVKEPNFLAYETHTIDDFSDIETKNHYLESVTDFDEYKTLFDKATEGQRVGEVSNTTLYMPNAIASIKKYLKDPKLIAILRNPAERLISRFMHLERVNKIPNTYLEEVFDQDSIWWQRADLIKEGFYYQHLSKFYSSFNKDDIKVILYSELKNDISSVLGGICTFLQIDDTFEFDASVIYNKSGKVKNKTVQQLIGDNSKLINWLKKIAPSIHKKLKNTKLLHTTIQRLRNKNLGKSQIDIGFKEKIINNIYLDDIKALEGLLNKDLSAWYQYPKE
ncbi:MAG: sulfotransferase [Bacteroidota bacterium]